MEFETLQGRLNRPPRKRPNLGLPIILGLLALILLAAPQVGGLALEYSWWREVGQVNTWFSQIIYGIVPVIAGGLLSFAIFWIAHARALKFAGTGLGEHRSYTVTSTIGLLLVGAIVATATLDSWTVIRFFGGLELPESATGFREPLFGLPLKFYLFDLPFYRMALGYGLALVIVSGLIFWLVARFWQLKDRLPRISRQGEFDVAWLRLEGGIESSFLRGAGALALLVLAVSFVLGRYELLYSEHGFMVGADYVDEVFRLPLAWAAAAAALVGALLIAIGRWKLAAGVLVGTLLIRGLVPLAVAGIYVRPNEISVEKPYIERHINATRKAFGLSDRVQELEFSTSLGTRIDPTAHKAIFDNVRLWDWQAFFDTISQIQALRPYYVFPDADVDRYMLNGELRQVLLTPRELDIRQLPDARTRWINPHFIYTHGYGVVMADATRISPDGLPYLLIQDAPAAVATDDVKLTRPELYFGEQLHEPVFVNSGQPEFNYPSGSDNVFSQYEGEGGFNISNPLLRLAAAIALGDFNILLTSYINENTRMMIRREVPDRLEHLAEFVTWDPDPYLVVTDAGRLVWTVDGYTTSNAHPYSQRVNHPDFGYARFNYIRNSVKATVDAYSGETLLYIFDPEDPVIQAYSRLFPDLLLPAERMPEDLRRHARYPEKLFSVQAQTYRLYHMQDPQAFYNKEDVWEVARNLYANEDRPQPVVPTYVVASLPGENQAEFLLILPFTPRNKDNMSGLTVARCDGENLGELVFLQLSKQELIFGPMQIEARINQDQNISKDLTLWNQQGSRVLRGQMLVLPVNDTFVYIEPIYLQAAEARMPQLKKVVIATGNDLIYTDRYEQALAALGGRAGVEAGPTKVGERTPGSTEAAAAIPSVPRTAAQIESIRQHLRRYRELSSQGRFAEAGKALEDIERELNPPQP